MEVIAGIDIGGTKCAVSFIHMNGDEVEFLSKEKRPTDCLLYTSPSPRDS